MAKDPRKYGGSNVPSQAPSRNVPYSPEIQPDIAVKDRMRGSKPFGYPARGEYVVATYDSRLPQNIDFDQEFSTRNSDSDDPVNRAEVSFQIPAGRTFVMKSFGVAVEQQLDGSSSPTSNVSLFGFNSNTIESGNNFFPQVSILIDDTPVPNYSDLFLFDLTSAYHKFECFILARGLQTVTLRSIFGGTAGDNTPHRSYWKVYGNFLLSKGDDILREPSNTDALPVKAGFFGRLAAAMEALAGK